MPFAVREVADQREALRILARMTRTGIGSPSIVNVARKLTNDCKSRDDRCELEAIFAAVRDGNKNVAALKKGLRYVSDPLPVDFFQGPARILKSCKLGACGGDCDEHGALVAALCGALGFHVGLRAWGSSRKPKGEFEHVYACVGFPKQNPPENPRAWLGMDTTEAEAFVGWDPPDGHWMTAVVT